MRTLVLFTCLLASSLAQAQSPRRGANDNDDEGGGVAALSALLHGGKVARSEAHRWEVVFGPETIRVYGYDAQGQPVSVRGITGRVDLLLVRAAANSVRRGVNHQSTGATLSYRAADPAHGRLRDCLVTKHTLGKVDVQGLRVDLSLSNVADEAGGKVEVRVEFVAYAGDGEWACAADGCTAVVFEDPGACPKCAAPLRRREQAERAREGDATGDATGDDAPEPDGERPRRRLRGR